MRKTIFILGFLFATTQLIAESNEEPKFRTYFDFGLFQSSFFLAENGGDYLSAGFGYKINEEFWLNLTLIKITSSGYFENNPFFENTNTNYRNTMVIPNFSKEWNIIKKLSIGGTIGGAFIFESVIIPYVEPTDTEYNISIFLSDQGDIFDLALFGEFFMKYEMTKNLFLILNAKSYIPMYMNPDSYMIGIGFEIKL